VGQLLILKAWIIFLVLRKIDFWKSFGSASKSLSQLKDHSLEISLFQWNIYDSMFGYFKGILIQACEKILDSFFLANGSKWISLIHWIGSKSNTNVPFELWWSWTVRQSLSLRLLIKGCNTLESTSWWRTQAAGETDMKFICEIIWKRFEMWSNGTVHFISILMQ